MINYGNHTALTVVLSLNQLAIWQLMAELSGEAILNDIISKCVASVT